MEFLKFLKENAVAAESYNLYVYVYHKYIYLYLCIYLYTIYLSIYMYVALPRRSYGGLQLACTCYVYITNIHINLDTYLFIDSHVTYI